MKHKSNFNVGKIPKSNRIIVETDKIDTPGTHDLSLIWLGTGTSIKTK